MGCVVYILLRRVWGGCVGREGYGTVCVPSCLDSVNRTLLRPTAPKGCHRFSQRGAALWHDAHWTLPRSLKVATGSECSGDEFGDLGGRSISRHMGLPATLPRARVGFCLQPAPATALADQLHCPDSSQVVCHSRSGPARTGSPPSHQDHGGCIGTEWGLERNAALRTRHETTFRSGCPCSTLRVAIQTKQE